MRFLYYKQKQTKPLVGVALRAMWLCSPARFRKRASESSSRPNPHLCEITPDCGHKPKKYIYLLSIGPKGSKRTQNYYIFQTVFSPITSTRTSKQSFIGHKPKKYLPSIYRSKRIKTIQKLLLLLGHLGLINFFGRTTKFGYKQAQRSGTRHYSQVPPVVYITLPMFCDKSAKCRMSAFYNMGGVILNIYVKFLYLFRVQR